MSVYLSPTFGIGYQGFSSAGLPLTAGKLYTYIAGGTTPQATYTTYLGNVQNDNPITLDASGRPPSEVWLTNGVAYRMDLKDALGNLIKSYDNVSMSSFVATSDLAATSGSSLVGFIQGGTSPTAETVQTALRRVVYPEQFGAVGNGSTDDKTALTNFINYLLANSQVEGRLLAKTYAISGALPQITVSGTRLIGFGPSSVHDTGAINGTVIKAITNTGFTMLTVAPTEGASAQRLDGVHISGISFNGDQKAAKGLVVKSVWASRIDVYVEECTTTNIELGVVTTLGEARDLQGSTFTLYGRNIFTTGNVLQVNGDATANVSLNKFDIVNFVHKDATGIVTQNPDNNIWGAVRVHRQAGGTATNSIEWQGGATTAQSTRYETYEKLTTTVAAIAKGTGTYTVAVRNVAIKTLDTSNGTPNPTVETGACLAGIWTTYTVTATSTVGTITTATSTGSYMIDPNDLSRVFIQNLVTITTNGTGAGVVRLNLPFASANVAFSATIPGIETASTGVMLRGLIAQNSSNLDITIYESSYPGADGRVLAMSGWYRRVVS